MQIWVMTLILVLSGPSISGARGDQTPSYPANRPDIRKRVIDDREIITQAKLEDPIKGLRRYSFYAMMQVNASPKTALDRFTDYPKYKEMSRFIQRVEKLPNGWVRIEGGVFGFQLKSLVDVRRIGDEKLVYEIREGHLVGLKGQVKLEKLPVRGSLILFDGQLSGQNWPPAFVMERGAEMVFGFAAQFMRTSMEKMEADPKENHEPENQSVPRPRKNFKP